MREVITKVYRVTELSDMAKQKAINNMRDINVDHTFYNEHIKDNLEEKLKDQGLRLDNAYYSGFYSQGDGACVEVTLIDLEQFLKAIDMPARHKALSRKLNLGFETKHRGRYYHEYSLHYSINMDTPHSKREAMVNDIESYIREHIVKICQEYYKELRDNYEYLISDEAVLDALDANELEFDENGELYS